MELQTLTLLSPGSAQEILKELRVRLLQFVLGFLIFSSVSFMIVLLSNGQDLRRGLNVISPLAVLFSIGFLIIVSRRQLIRAIGIIVIGYLIVISLVFFSLDTENIAILYLMLALASLVSSVLSHQIVFRVVSLIILIVITIAGIFVISNTTGGAGILLTISMGLVPLAIGAITRYFVSSIEATAVTAQRSATLLAASADIGRNVSEMLELKVLLKRAVEIIRDRFAFYHVSIFLLDDAGSYAHLTASTGEVGERMLARGHRLPVNAKSVVGRAAQAKDVIIARDTDSDSGHSFNELLPFTRSELAVPIVDTDGIVAVVDIQSRRPDAFTTTEIGALRVITNQLATAIRNARLFEDKERSINENKRLFIEAETNLREIQRLNRQLTKQAWTDYLRADRRIDGVTLLHGGFRNKAEWTQEMVDASRRRRAITAERDGKQTVAVPIELRGEVVGAIELETDGETGRDDLVDMVRTVSSRLAVSLDNARLFEESNEATAQEQRVSEIVSQYQAADSVDELLRVTLEGLAETLGAEQASIRLGAVPQIASIEGEEEESAPGTNGGESHDDTTIR